MLCQILSIFVALTATYASPVQRQSRDARLDSEPYSIPPNCSCNGTNENKTLLHTYVCGDTRLGPVRLPTHLPLDDLVDTYDRFDGLCPGDFLAKWYNAIAGSYIYPPDNGFQLNVNGAPIEGTVSLPVGMLLDRFGSEYGSFVSPQGAPYMQRALPPSNLDTPAGDPR